MVKFYSFVLMLALLVGCETKLVEKNYTSQNYTPAVSAFLVHEGLMNPAVTPVSNTKYKRSECPECKGAGIIYPDGGGVKLECPYCEVDKGSVGQTVVTLEEAVKPTALAQCCPHCICGDNCQCIYPGQCLIKKNNGWPVKVCNGTECAVYYPQDTVGTTYNPFDFLPAQDKVRYSKYKNPIPVDIKGNAISEQVFSQGCAACSTNSTRWGRR